MANKPKLYGDRWKVTNSFAEGGQGQIFSVVDTKGTDATVYALKRIKNPERRQRFISEVTACKMLAHPNIIRLIDHAAFEPDATDDRMYLVMPLLHGGSLDARFSDFTGHIDKVIALSLALLAAVEYAHINRVIHRDLKPENILFESKVSVDPIVSDFGICLIAGHPRATESDEVVGPRFFMAPELEAGQQLDISPSCDLYSLGKLIYFAYSGGARIFREETQNLAWLNATDTKTLMLAQLVRSLVAPLSQRASDISNIRQRLQDIRDFDSRPENPVSGTAMNNALQVAQEKEKVKQRTAASAILMEQENKDFSNVNNQINIFIRDSIETSVAQLKPVLSELDYFESSLRPDDKERVQGYEFIPHWQIGMKYGLPSEGLRGNYRHYLKFIFGRLPPDSADTRKVMLSEMPKYLPPRFVVLARYVNTMERSEPFYIPGRSNAGPNKISPPLPTDVAEQVLYLVGKVSDWPAKQGDLTSILRMSIEWFTNWLSQDLHDA